MIDELNFTTEEEAARLIVLHEWTDRVMESGSRQQASFADGLFDRACLYFERVCILDGVDHDEVIAASLCSPQEQAATNQDFTCHHPIPVVTLACLIVEGIYPEEIFGS